MSDPTAIIVAIVIAASGAVNGADLPQPIKEQAGEAVQSAEQAVPGAVQQVDDFVSTLPPDTRPSVQQGLDDAVDAFADVVEPYLPLPDQVNPPVPVGVDGGPGTSPPLNVADPLPGPEMAGTSGPSATGIANNGAGESPFTTLRPATVLGVSPTPVGALAVFAPWLTKAGNLCDGVKAYTLAALYSAENGFRYGANAPVSSAGARGPGQFIDSTWRKYGKDADGDGFADILGVADSVMASGHLMCDMFSQIDAWKIQGLVTGDTLDLTIAGYNAGLGAVLQHGGMPSGSVDYENQTKPYVTKIRSTEDGFARMLSPFNGLTISGLGQQITERALSYLGLPYVWGGGGIYGPSGGGFDCSGLTSYAVHAASGGKNTLPRTSEQQWSIGTEIPIQEAVPGDLLFGNWGSGGPGHVAIYLGEGQMIHAPTTGDVVRIAPVFDGMKVRRVL